MAGEQKAIAGALNMSEATVSRSLRGHPAVSAVTRARVAEAAFRMGYKFSSKATASMESGLNGEPREMVHLGVLCRGIAQSGAHDSVTFRRIQGMSTAARENRATLHVEYLPPEYYDKLEDSASWPPAMRESVLSGLILMDDVSAAAEEALSARQPCVRMTYPGPREKLDCVTDDDLLKVGKLVDHLLRLGHRRIGLADFGYGTAVTRMRLFGYMKALADNALEYDAANAQFLGADPTRGAQRAEKVADYLLRRVTEAGVRAWICPNDYLGYLLVGALQARGARVPEDVSVCGFDNFDPPPAMPKLTTVDGPFETLGAAAVRQLMRRVVHGDQAGEPVHLIYGAKLVVGESTAPPGSG